MGRQCEQPANTIRNGLWLQQFAEREKTAYARDLHDDLGGLLIAAVMDLETILPQMTALPEDARARFSRAQRALQSAIDMDSQNLKVLAAVVSAFFTGPAMTARDVRFNRASVSDMDSNLVRVHTHHCA